MHSVVVAVDGEAECGKTTTIYGIETEALYQASLIPGMLSGDPTISDVPPDWFPEASTQSLINLQGHLAFNSIAQISAGNMFRAATLYKVLLELQGQPRAQFEPADTDGVRELLLVPGIKDVLQTDPNIKNQVSPTAKLLGVQALCSAIFCDAIVEAYHADGGGNLVIVDARDPIGHLRRNAALGKGGRQIDPTSVMPIYIDTPAEVAASRGSGDYDANLARIRMRRETDTSRTELPVVRPTELLDEYGEWLRRLFTNMKDGEAPVPPFRLDNGESLGLGGIQNFSGHIAVAAQELGHNLFHRDFPGAVCWNPA